MIAPALALPCATALASTFSHELVREAGALLAEESKARGAVCLLAPTVNIARSPLGGRTFESFSEDPTLSGQMASDYIQGLQGNGVSAVIKHFVANDQEHERTAYNAIIDDRTLHEVYLRPFQIAQKHSKPWAIMTSYNKVNGLHSSENPTLIDILRNEWKFNGLIMSDWYGTYSVSDSINAGMDLEMPGPSIWRNWSQMNHLITARKIDIRQIDRLASEVLSWVQNLARQNRDLVFHPIEERTRTEAQASDAVLLRRLATESLVLLKNDRNVLPLSSGETVACVGPNCEVASVTGGGSAALNASWTVSPWQGLTDNNPGVNLEKAQGCIGAKFLPLFGAEFTRASGDAGIDLAHYAIVGGQSLTEPTVLDTSHTSSVYLCDFIDERLGEKYITELTSTFTPTQSGAYDFGIAVSGMGWLWLDDELVIDLSKNQSRGGPDSAFSGSATTERRGRVSVTKGKSYRLRVLHDARLPPAEELNGTMPFNQEVAFRVGASPTVDEPRLSEEALSLARRSSKVAIFVGLNADWESEGYDRATLNLPLGQDALISNIAAVNPNTVVVIQAGSAVAMPWINEVAAVVYAWYGGNECGNAIADVLYGHVSPSGRLPLSLPRRERDIPAHKEYGCTEGDVRYAEGIWVGYKHYNARGVAPLFPFGHGLSYTSFDYSDLAVDSVSEEDEWGLGASVTVTNTGKVAGSHSVHFYTCPPPTRPPGLAQPSHAIQAYGKTGMLAPGASERITCHLDKCEYVLLSLSDHADAVSHWSTRKQKWVIGSGQWNLRVGLDAQTLWGSAHFSLQRDIEWSGV